MKINTHTSHPSAFISSTFIDLVEERMAVADVLRRSNLNINALDVKPASSDSSKKEILTGINESDFIILIVGERYGSIIPKMTMSKVLSITRWEYVKAVKNMKKDALVFFKRVNSNDSIYYDDTNDSNYNLKRKYLEEFKAELSHIHSPKYFNTAEELANHIQQALIPTYRAGVKSLIAKNNLLQKEVARLKLDNQTIMQPSSPVSSPILSGNQFKRELTGIKGLMSMGLENATTKETKSTGIVNSILKAGLDKK